MNSQRLVAIGASSILALEGTMLLVDERLAIFPYIFGIDLRYLLCLGLFGIVAVVLVLKKVSKK